MSLLLRSLLVVGLLAASLQADEPLWTAKPLTPEKSFTTGIEGPNSDADGIVYCVAYQNRGTIAKVSPEGAIEVFVNLPMGTQPDAKGKTKQSAGNGIVFDSQERMYVADYANHNVLRIDMKTKAIETFAHDDRFNQPNDLAIGPDDVIWCSDPAWGKNTGQILRVDTKGVVTLAAENLGTTNGIEVSPDGKTLYVNESVQRGIWAFPIGADGKLGERKLVKQFTDHGFDGMRCDAEGRLFVTRHGAGKVVVLSPTGELLHEIDVLGTKPSNVCFGGPDGKTVFVTEVEKTRLVTFRSDVPGLNYARRQAAKK